MNIGQRISLCLAMALLALGPVGVVWGATVSGRASTVLEWRDDPQGDAALPGYQYLQLNIGDIAGKGIDFRGYGRLADDFNNELDIDSRLYYAYLEKKGLLPSLDAKFGRQFISTTAGASIMDGLYLNYDKLGPLKLALFGGGDVAYYTGYNAEDFIAGGKVSGQFFDSLDLGLSYIQKWNDSELSHELIGFDVAYDVKELINLYSETQYSWLTEEVTYFLAGAHYYRNPKWSLRTEYLYSLPVFSATSIYSVFSVAEYQELMAELTYSIVPGLRAFGRYSREMYEDYDDGNVFEAGLEKIRTARCAGYLTGVWRDDGDGQDLKGFKIYGSYLLNQLLQAGAGAHVDVLERRLDDTDDETSSSRLWVDLTAYLSKTLNVEAKAERIESDLWDEYYQGRIRLNVLF
ncbi:MAG: hypothetical protein ACYDAI_09960 [Trichloromonadaceae bacterium]